MPPEAPPDSSSQSQASLSKRTVLIFIVITSLNSFLIFITLICILRHYSLVLPIQRNGSYLGFFQSTVYPSISFLWASVKGQRPFTLQVFTQSHFSTVIIKLLTCAYAHYISGLIRPRLNSFDKTVNMVMFFHQEAHDI